MPARPQGQHSAVDRLADDAYWGEQGELARIYLDLDPARRARLMHRARLLHWRAMRRTDSPPAAPPPGPAGGDPIDTKDTP